MFLLSYFEGKNKAILNPKNCKVLDKFKILFKLFNCLKIVKQKLILKWDITKPLCMEKFSALNAYLRKENQLK